MATRKVTIDYSFDVELELDAVVSVSGGEGRKGYRSNWHEGPGYECNVDKLRLCLTPKQEDACRKVIEAIRCNSDIAAVALGILFALHPEEEDRICNRAEESACSQNRED